MSAFTMIIVVFLGLLGLSFFIPDSSSFSSFSVDLPTSVLPTIDFSMSGLLSIILGAFTLIWMATQLKKSSEFYSESDSNLTNFLRKIILPFKSKSPKSKAKNELKDLKKKRKKLQKNLKTVKNSREKALKKLSKLSAEPGRVSNYLNERRRDYGRKLMYTWKSMFDIEIIDTENFEAYSQRVISHLEAELQMINELLKIETKVEITEEETTYELVEESRIVNKINQELKDLELTEEKLKEKAEDSNIFIQKVDSESKIIKQELSQLLQSLIQTHKKDFENFKEISENIKTLASKSELNITSSVKKLETDAEELQKIIAEQGNKLVELSKRFVKVKGTVNVQQLLQVDSQGNAQTLIVHLEEMKSELVQIENEIKIDGPNMVRLDKNLATDMDAIRKQLNAKSTNESKLTLDKKLLIFKEGTTFKANESKIEEEQQEFELDETLNKKFTELIKLIEDTIRIFMNAETYHKKHTEYMGQIMRRKAATMENDNDSKLTWGSMRVQLVELRRIAKQNNKRIFNSKIEFTNILFKLRRIASVENMKLFEIERRFRNNTVKNGKSMIDDADEYKVFSSLQKDLEDLVKKSDDLITVATSQV